MTHIVVEVEEGERDLWDQAVNTFTHAHPLNAYGWGKVREIDGWQPSYFLAKDGENIKGMLMILSKKIPLTSLSIMYAPKGPLYDLKDSNILKILIQRAREEGRKKRAIFLRIDPNISENQIAENDDPFVKGGFIHLDHRWTFWNSPRDVFRIDLTRASTEADLFNSIDRDARRCVRKAQKEGVIIKPAETLNELQIFYEIFSQFTVGKGFMCRKLLYQEVLWREYIEKGNGRLFLAVYNGKIIGGLICILYNRKCLAMHMGTPGKYNKLHTYYAYVWESIRWAKERGCLWYSFRGVGTTPTQESFKKKFHPQIVALVGYYDLSFRPLLYWIFSKIEFTVLPKVLKIFMRLRRGYKRILEKVWSEITRPVNARRINKC